SGPPDSRGRPARSGESRALGRLVADSALGLVFVEQSEAVRGGGGLDPAGHLELAEDVGDVDAGGLGADEQCLADLAVGPAVGNQREDLAFAGGEPERVGWPPWSGLVGGWWSGQVDA